jgi:serpin B
MSTNGCTNGARRPSLPGALRCIAALLLVATVAAACGSSAASVASPSSPANSNLPANGGIELVQAHLTRPDVSASDAAQAAGAINAFGLDLYRRAAGSGNAVMSPASIALALAMARAGARGQTAAQIDTVLHAFGSDANANGVNSLQQALAGLSGTFTDAKGDKHELTLRIANAPFSQRGMTLKQAYIDALSTRFGAGIRLVDYIKNAEAARLLINGWVSDQTEKRIPELLAQGTIDTNTRLALVNAIYMKAPWQTPFTADSTHDAAFTLADGSHVNVPTMSGTMPALYAAGSGWKAVELSYAGGSLAMTVIVPDNLATFESSLNAAVFAQITGALKSDDVALTLPKFKIETKIELADVLAAMGMGDAFNGEKADFSGITEPDKLFISAVVHQANIDVDEKGTEAAAATAVVMGVMAIPGPAVTLNVDHPFIFAVRDTTTGAILFLGRVANPSS